MSARTLLARSQHANELVRYKNFLSISQNSILLFDRFYIFAYMTSHEI